MECLYFLPNPIKISCKVFARHYTIASSDFYLKGIDTKFPYSVYFLWDFLTKHFPFSNQSLPRENVIDGWVIWLSVQISCATCSQFAKCPSASCIFFVFTRPKFLHTYSPRCNLSSIASYFPNSTPAHLLLNLFMTYIVYIYKWPCQRDFSLYCIMFYDFIFSG